MLIGPRISLEIATQSRLNREITRLMNEISGEKRILSPSDDPHAAARVAAIARDQVDQAGWKANVTAAEALAQRADSALGDIRDMMDRAAELISAARGPSGDKVVAALELKAYADEMRLAVQQRDSRGQAVFADGEPLEIPMGGSALLTANPSRESVFGVAGDTLADRLDAAAAALVGGDDAAIAAAFDGITAGQTQVADAIGAQGVRGARIDFALGRLTSQGATAAEERSALEATDLTTAIPELATKRLTLDAAQAAFAQVNRRTLFDLLG
jgi:flagellar hook-associated protein 3 FlgL